ncbi:class I SAM-dependent methyltransferase [Vagococcus lutrae]|nr:class I SAM-dependent methyltransferase [Vagococcus lutrae]MDO5742348.1 class I SAM-dependent methyltransferase [Vagococcus sp.]MDT2801909.1 class I SAM-dependent methyltransferase [Vagococcus lutrae]
MRILDACCGSRMFWFDKENPDVTFMDIREEEFEIHKKKVNVKPDVVGDFRDMPFENNTFDMVVFDPPHLRWAGPNSIMKAQYGQLNEDWPDDIKKGFEECFRVLKPSGSLIFKWASVQIPLKEVLKLVPQQPLFGQKRNTTHWLVFMKN